MRKRRDELERSIAGMDNMVRKADDLVSKVDLALSFLKGNMNFFNSNPNASTQERQWMGARIILAQEDERRRVAREIHDGPAQAMANVVPGRRRNCWRTSDRRSTKNSLELKEVVNRVPKRSGNF